MPANVQFPVVGTALVLNCETDIAEPSTYEWYKGGTKDSTTGKSLTIAGDKANDGDYKCIVLDSSGLKSAESPVTSIAFNSKS